MHNGIAPAEVAGRRNSSLGILPGTSRIGRNGPGHPGQDRSGRKKTPGPAGATSGEAGTTSGNTTGKTYTCTYATPRYPTAAAPGYNSCTPAAAAGNPTTGLLSAAGLLSTAGLLSAGIFASRGNWINSGILKSIGSRVVC